MTASYPGLIMPGMTDPFAPLLTIRHYGWLGSSFILVDVVDVF